MEACKIPRMTHLKPMTSSENTPFHILVVDPDPIVLSALTQQLESEGFQVSTTEKPEEALSALPSHDFAVVVAAQEMVGMTGIDFFSRVKQVSPGSTRLLVSSQMPLVTLLEAVKSGAIDRFLVKPWLRGELLSMVKNCAALRVAAANAGEAGRSTRRGGGRRWRKRLVSRIRRICSGWGRLWRQHGGGIHRHARIVSPESRKCVEPDNGPVRDHQPGLKSFRRAGA